jgi:hypothetical protein
LEFDFVPTYTITFRATKEQCEDSDITTVTICWIACTENHDEQPGESIITIPSKVILIQNQGGTITLSGGADGTDVTAYDTAGRELATATTTDGTATLATDLTEGEIAIVKIGNSQVKVVIK